MYKDTLESFQKILDRSEKYRYKGDSHSVISWYSDIKEKDEHLGRCPLRFRPFGYFERHEKFNLMEGFITNKMR